MVISGVSTSDKSSTEKTLNKTASIPSASSSKPSKPSHPSYSKMIVAAVKSLPDGKPASLKFVLKYIATNYDCGFNQERLSRYVKSAIRRDTETGVLHRLTGVGALGSFCLPNSKLAKSAKKKKSEKTPPAKAPTDDAKPVVKDAPKATKKPAGKATKVKKTEAKVSKKSAPKEVTKVNKQVKKAEAKVSKKSMAKKVTKVNKQIKKAEARVSKKKASA